jgi:hypothetical protein
MQKIFDSACEFPNIVTLFARENISAKLTTFRNHRPIKVDYEKYNQNLSLGK